VWKKLKVRERTGNWVYFFPGMSGGWASAVKSLVYHWHGDITLLKSLDAKEVYKVGKARYLNSVGQDNFASVSICNFPCAIPYLCL
jgi:hypothetical protein